jgi:hypothetical protein
MVSLQWLEPSDSGGCGASDCSDVDHWSFGDRDLNHRSHRQNVGV